MKKVAVWTIEIDVDAADLLVGVFRNDKRQGPGIRLPVEDAAIDVTLCIAGPVSGQRHQNENPTKEGRA